MRNSIFMAFAKGSESKEGGVNKLYTGVGGVFIRAINPSKEELTKLYGRDIDKDPVYITEKDGKKSVRLTFICQFDPLTNNNVKDFVNITFFLRNEARVGTESGKTQIIDKYGRTAWADAEVLAVKGIPVYSNGPAKIDAEYRPCYAGEENLISFLKQYLGIENIDVYSNGAWITNSNPENCVAALEKIPDFFTGDFKELRDIIGLQPMNKVKALFGVRTDDNGNQYQDVYSNKFLKNNVTAYSNLFKAVKDSQEHGGYATTDFQLDHVDHNLKPYVVTPTAINPSNAPFPPTDTSNPWG